LRVKHWEVRVLVEETHGEVVVLVPEGRLVMGGPAEEFEKRVQDLFAEGKRAVITDLHRVTQVDSTGIRGFVRGHTTAQKVKGRFALCEQQYSVQLVLEITRLNTLLDMHPSLQDALESMPGGK
jgi:anti-sigma B factor antagonist